MDGIAQYLIAKKLGFLLEQPVALGMAMTSMQGEPKLFSFQLMPTTASNISRDPALHREAANR